MESFRVLIVDDVPQVRQGLATVLRLAARKAGLTIEVVGQAQNGRDAIQQARLLLPDVVLMDLEMPVMNGYEATRQIKAGQSAIRVIVLSVQADPDSRERARAAGADGFVAKGSSYAALLDAILIDGPFISTSEE